MARPLGFDPDAARDALMRVFWDRGYEGTSMQDIEAGTGLAKQSLYRLFGDKRGMYRAALRRFDEVELAAAEALLADAPGPPQDALAQLFEGVIAAAEVAGAPRGCFLSNACAESDPADLETQGLLTDMTARLATALRTALARDARYAADPALAEARARHLQAVYVGLRVLLKGGLDPATARALAADAIAAI